VSARLRRREPFLGLSLSLLFGSMDLRGLEVPKSSKGRGWSRSKSSRGRHCDATARRARCKYAREGTAGRDGDEGSVTLTHSILAVLGVSRTALTQLLLPPLSL